MTSASVTSQMHRALYLELKWIYLCLRPPPSVSASVRPGVRPVIARYLTNRWAEFQILVDDVVEATGELIRF